jgi:hypothetical protein
MAFIIFYLKSNFMMRKYFFICFFCLVTAQLFAQTSDRSQIEAVIQSYFDGWLTGDTTKIGYAMHASCKLKNFRDSFVEMDRSTYLSRFQPRTRPANTDARIIQITITEGIASAKCEIETERYLFTDYFNLMRMGERWYIVDKVATRADKTLMSKPTPNDSIEKNSRALAQAQLDAYNKRDIDAFLKPYSDSVKVFGFPQQFFYKGIGTMRSQYQQMFSTTPDLHCELVGRMVLGNYVIDREWVTFNKQKPKMSAIAIYKISQGKIEEVYFIMP